MGQTTSNENEEALRQAHTFELETVKGKDVKDLRSTVITETHRNLMNGIRVVDYGPLQGVQYITRSEPIIEFNCLRKLVSKKKIRYRDAFYDLDLVYITKRLIAMGFPAAGFEALYRNSAYDVVAFFERYHFGCAKIYNLCLEDDRNYRTDYFYRKGLEVGYFPFKDHCPCSLRTMFEFCVDAYLYLVKDPRNVIGVHCKAGKGRTGMMICAFLIFAELCTTTEQALHLYGSRRTIDGKGVTIASQIRYITYFERLLKERCVTEYPKMVIDFLNNPQAALEKYVPLNNKKYLKVINIGPFIKNYAFGFHFEDLNGNVKATFNYPVDDPDDQIIDLDEIGEVRKTVGTDKSIVYEIIIPDDSVVFEDDLKVFIFVEDVKLVACFNVGFLRPYRKFNEYLRESEKPVMYDNYARKMLKPMRRFYYGEKYQSVKRKLLIEEFHSYDFDKWARNKRAQKILSEDFSLIMGFNDYDGVEQSIIDD